MTFAVNMLGTVIFYQVYELTRDNFKVGMIGLVEFIPFVIVTFFSGYLADILDRKKIIATSIFTYIFCIVFLLLLSTKLNFLFTTFGVSLIYLVNFVIGAIRGFLSPALSAFAAQLVPEEFYPYSSNWLTITWHIGSVGGPAVGGLLYGWYGVDTAYVVIMILVMLSFLVFLTVPKQKTLERNKKEPILTSLSVGLKFVFNNQILLGALALDMFAVLFGGAVAMLPGFADKILNQGPEGLGFLRAAPAVGAIIMGIYLTKNPPIINAGRKLLWSVLGFGAATILFAFSTNFYLSLFALALTGLFDDVSMVIRGTIVQLYTPNEMRGRVSAVNGIFIGSSNELGAFESGVAARFMGLVPSVAFGGCMTLLVVALTAKFAPKLRDLSIDMEK
jgi:MFS family permease